MLHNLGQLLVPLSSVQVQVDSDNILHVVAILVSLSAGQYSLAVLSYVNAGSDSQRVVRSVCFGLYSWLASCW